MIAIRNISRFRAASIHLAISAGIAAAVLAVMLALWYPPPLFAAMGGKELIVLIVGVDVAIGPLITLIIFDTRKKELVFDLAVIAALQLAALSYGVYAMHAGRPVFTVFTGDQFAIVSAAKLDLKYLAEGKIEAFRTLSLTGPRLVAAELPTNPEELSNLAVAAFAGGGIQEFPKYFVPYTDKRPEVLAASRPLSDLDPSEEDRERLQRYLNDSGRQGGQLRCLPVSTKQGVMTALVDAATGDLVAILDIPPHVRQR